MYLLRKFTTFMKSSFAIDTRPSCTRFPFFEEKKKKKKKKKKKDKEKKTKNIQNRSRSAKSSGGASL